MKNLGLMLVNISLNFKDFSCLFNIPVCFVLPYIWCVKVI